RAADHRAKHDRAQKETGERPELRHLTPEVAAQEHCADDRLDDVRSCEAQCHRNGLVVLKIDRDLGDGHQCQEQRPVSAASKHQRREGHTRRREEWGSGRRGPEKPERKLSAQRVQTAHDDREPDGIRPLRETPGARGRACDRCHHENNVVVLRLVRPPATPTRRGKAGGPGGEGPPALLFLRGSAYRFPRRGDLSNLMYLLPAIVRPAIPATAPISTIPVATHALTLS